MTTTIETPAGQESAAKLDALPCPVWCVLPAGHEAWTFGEGSVEAFLEHVAFTRTLHNTGPETVTVTVGQSESFHPAEGHMVCDVQLCIEGGVNMECPEAARLFAETVTHAASLLRAIKGE